MPIDNVILEFSISCFFNIWRRLKISGQFLEVCIPVLDVNYWVTVYPNFFNGFFMSTPESVSFQFLPHQKVSDYFFVCLFQVTDFNSNFIIKVFKFWVCTTGVFIISFSVFMTFVVEVIVLIQFLLFFSFPIFFSFPSSFFATLFFPKNL